MYSPQTLEWSADFSVGMPEIDAQHAEIFSQILSLKRACEEGRGKSEVDSVIAYLHKYVVEHFNEEEAYQESIGFPEFLEHKRMHNEFGKMVKAFAARFDAEGPSELLVSEINRYMLNWLVVHVVVEDQKYVDHARRTMN